VRSDKLLHRVVS